MILTLNKLQHLPRGSRVCIYGTGQGGQYFLKRLQKKRKDIQVLFFVDSFRRGHLDQLEILLPEDIPQYQDELDWVLITSAYWRDMIPRLSHNGVENYWVVAPGLMVSKPRHLYHRVRHYLKKILYFLLKIPVFLYIPTALLISRLRCGCKPFDVGIGPEPLLNNVYHKKALEKKGWRVQTFVSNVYHITKAFDVRGDRRFKVPPPLRYYLLFLMVLHRYRCLYTSFKGGPLGFTGLRRWEPYFYKFARIKTVILPYGSDVQDMSRQTNLLHKHANCKDYPWYKTQRKKIVKMIDLWTLQASHIIGGCEWVDYMYHWDTLMLAHFSIDTRACQPSGPPSAQPPKPGGKDTLRILHAPNHRHLKGTHHFIRAVEELKQEGLPVELIILEKVPNEKVKEMIASVDLVADQLIVGWYALFAIEAMVMEKPVLCYIREDLENLYIEAGLISKGELPIIKCTFNTVKEIIKGLLQRNWQEELQAMGQRSRQFVIRHHSLDHVGGVFHRINRAIGLSPTNRDKKTGRT